MTRIYLVRHGETSGNEKGMFRGTSDYLLNMKGKEQAFRVGVFFSEHPPDAVYSSPLKRAEDSADAIAEPNILPVLIEPRFNDLNFGEWQEKAISQVEQEYPDIFRDWMKNPFSAKIPGAGSLKELEKKACEALYEIGGRHKNDKSIVVVSHRLVLKIIICSMLGMGEEGFWKIRLDCGSISLLEHDNGRFVLSLLNSACHLDSMKSPAIDG